MRPKLLSRKSLIATTLIGLAAVCPAATLTKTSFISNATDPTNLNVATKTKTESLTDASGVVFTYSITWTGIGGTLTASGGTTAGEFGINGAGADNNAIDTSGEGVSFTVSNITVTNYNGYDPGDVTISFDKFTTVALYFVTNTGDSGAITDGTNDLWTWGGALGIADTDTEITGNSSNDALFSFLGVMPNGGNNGAIVDVSGFNETTLAVDWRNTGDLSVNRWRVDDITAQFTVTAIPEPGAALLGGLGFLALFRRRR